MTDDIKLVVKSGPLKGHEYSLNKDSIISIGRSEESSIRIAYDEFCSRKHAFVYLENDICYIRDLGSTNGTRVNKVLIDKETKLSDGDIIGLGNTELLTVYPGNPENQKGKLNGEVSYEE